MRRTRQILFSRLLIRINQTLDDRVFLISRFKNNKKIVCQRPWLRPTWLNRDHGCYLAYFFFLPGRPLPCPSCCSSGHVIDEIKRRETKEKSEEERIRACCRHSPPPPSSTVPLYLEILVRHHLILSFCAQISCSLVHDRCTMCDIDQNSNLVVATRVVVRWRRGRKGGVEHRALVVMLLWLPYVRCKILIHFFGKFCGSNNSIRRGLVGVIPKFPK